MQNITFAMSASKYTANSDMINEGTEMTSNFCSQLLQTKNMISTSL